MKLILSFLCTLLIIAVEGQNTTITGNINGNAPAKIFFYEVLQQPVLIDSADVNTKGEFKIKTEIKTTGFYRIQSDVKNFMMLILKPGDNLTIQANGGKMNKNPQIKGSPESVLIYKYGTLIDAIAEALDSLSGIIKGSNYTGEQQVARQAAMQKHEELTLKQTEIVREMFSKHPGSLACMFFVNLLPPASHPDVYTKVDSALYSQYPDNIYVKDLHQKLTPLLFLSEGSVAPEITQPDTAGKIRKLSEFRGKYVLIDFWASWCGPCRREIPILKDVYAKYKDKGFEIFSISLDKSEAAWKAAIYVNELNWIQVGDMKYWACVPAKEYGVSGIPFMLLLDKEGKIIQKNLRGEELKQRLIEIFGE